MVEVIMATLLTGVVIVGALNVMGGAIKTRRASVASVDGPRLANELLAEIMGKAYEDPEAPGTGEYLGVGREPGETTRSTFDDVDDYYNYSESPPLDINEIPMSAYENWSREVFWSYAKLDTGIAWDSETGLERIVVVVTAPDGTLTQRTGYRWREGALERPAAINSQIITWAGAELQIGGQGVARAGTNLNNAPSD